MERDASSSASPPAASAGSSGPAAAPGTGHQWPPRGNAPQALLGRLAHDYAYVLPGFPIAVVGFALLVALTAASVGTFVIWVGALLMPLTLVIASGLADLSRRRLRAWGVALPPVRYKPAGAGITGPLRLMTDARRWLDLVFEAVIAFPLRTVTFVVAVTWTAGVVGGLTHWLWARFLPPGESGWSQLLSVGFPELVPRTERGAHLLDSGINLVLGAVFLLTLPAVMRGLALFDASLTAALLGDHTGDAPARTATADGPPAADAPPAEPRPIAFSGQAWAWVGVSALAIALLAVGWPVLAALHEVHPAVAMVLAAGQSAAVVLALRWPWAGIGASTLAALGTMLATSGAATGLPWPWPVTTLVAQCLVVAVVAVRHRWFWAAVAWTAGALATVVAFLVAGGVPAGGLANGIVLASVTAGLALLGALARTWTRNAGRAERAERLSAEEAQRRRDLEERNRIARELHDVVAHSMSVITVQATTARYRKPGIDPAVQREFDDIAASSRQALGEMRALLALLRDDEDVPTAPVPGLGDIPDLVESTRASGTTITWSGTDADVPPTVGLTAFRVVQEALSNALRHAPGAAVEVTTAVVRETLTVRVVNSPPESGAESAPGSGLGLAGIRERVAALDGRVEAGPTPGGGFALEVGLPLGDGTDR